MSYFPAFIKLENKKILVVGGGKIAASKLIHLLDFTDDITVLAQEFSEEMRLCLKKAEQIQSIEKTYAGGDVEGYDIVVVAVDTIALQAAIFEETRRLGILCNAVDSTAYCDFIFPAYIQKDDLVIAISTGGASPAMAKHIRRYIEALIPKNIGQFLKEMRELRESLPKGKERMQMLDAKAAAYMKNWRK